MTFTGFVNFPSPTTSHQDFSNKTKWSIRKNNPYMCMQTNSRQQLITARKKIAEVLRTDLLRQYEEPNRLDWSIYDKDVSFDDPMTRLQGKLLYKGMILTIGFILVRFLFRNGKASFELPECELTADGEKVRTKFITSGTTKWGSELTISGEDFFWFKEGSIKIIRHQSTWDQTPKEVTDTFLGAK